MVEISHKSNSATTNSGGKGVIINNTKKMKMKKKPPIDVPDPSQASSSSSSSCCVSSSRKGFRVAIKRRNPRVMIGSARQKESSIEGLALPLGMSIAAVIAQVLERKDAAGGRMPLDHLSMICSLAVRESLANVFGNKFDCFMQNFEKSFRSTLKTLRLISESSQSNGDHPRHVKKEIRSDLTSFMSLGSEGNCTCNSIVKDCQSEADVPTISTRERLTILEDNEDNGTDQMNHDLGLHDEQINQQLTCIPPNAMHSIVNQSMIKSVREQARANDLKTLEISLTMRKMQMKAKELVLNSELNLLERIKLSMGISKASFKAEKFKNQLEDTRYAELLKLCIDCLVAGLFIMLVCLGYGAYIYSHQRITEATASCTPPEETKSWWTPKPVASFNFGLQMLRCQVQVVSRMLFGVLMIAAIAVLLLQRSATSKQTMPITFILLLLGIACGFVGKLCIDTLGGSGYHWLFYWEALCLMHFFSNVCTPTLFLILYGPITVSRGSKCYTIVPHWIRRLLFFATVLLFMPLLCGFMPFAGPVEWKNHFFSLVIDLFSM